MTTQRASSPSNGGTYDILIAGLQALNTKVTELSATVSSLVGRLDDFQRSVETRYMPRTEFEAALNESRDDRKEIRNMMVYRDAYLAASAETVRRLDRLENGPQRFLGWAGLIGGCLSIVISGVGLFLMAASVVTTIIVLFR